MNNFVFHNPTRIVFGGDGVRSLPSFVPRGASILLTTYRDETVRGLAVFDEIAEALRGWKLRQFAEVEPNPTFETLMDAVRIVREEGIDFLLAVGGGSVIDGTKFIAAAVPFKGSDPWTILSERAEVKEAVPFGVVLTLPGTGSEMTAGAIISREATQEKLGFSSEHVFPRFSILDPSTTLSLPRGQVRNGVVDAFIHTLENYLTYPVDAPLQDRQAEAILLTLVEEGPKTLADLQDYDSRANLMWCATHAMNGLIRCGVPIDWTTHRIGHELTAFYGIAHAESIAPIILAVMRHQRERKRSKLLQYARRVWKIDDTDEESVIDEAIMATEQFFQELGMPTRLSEVGVPTDEAGERVHARFKQRQTKLGEHGDITPNQVAEIISLSG